MDNNFKRLLTASKFKNWLSCNYTIINEINKKELKKKERSKTEEIRTERGDEFEENIYKELIKKYPKHIKIKKNDNKIDETKKAIEKGYDLIHKAYFENEGWHGEIDFLIKVEGKKTNLGNFGYELYDSKLSSFEKTDHIIQLNIYNEWLEKLQGSNQKTPDHTWLFLGNKEDRFQKLFLSSLLKQINFLKKNLKIISYETTQISCLAAIILSGLVFKEYFNNYHFGLKELNKIINNFFDKNGFPKNKNSENLIIFLQYFILIKEWIKSAQEPVPDYIDEIIEKNLICLNSLKNESKRLPLFNGVTEKNLEEFFLYLEKLNYQFDKKLKFVGQIQIIKNKKNILYFDSGEPPLHQFSRDYQSGPLSFEYFNEDNKIITNCGYGRKISKKTQLISKFTSAQSTLCLNDTSVVKFKKNNLINKIYGPTISNSFKIFDINREENKADISVAATHNAYLNKFGYLHKRLIKILKKNGDIIGTDSLIKKKLPIKIIETKYGIRS